jgi:uncharacterized protein
MTRCAPAWPGIVRVLALSSPSAALGREGKTSMQCFVYKSVRKADTYVFLRESEAFAVLPPELAERLGELAFVIEIDLSPQRKLAREDVTVVMANLSQRGYHLQLPPPPELLLSGDA